MHKKITKLLILILAVAMAITAFSGCSKKKLEGDYNGDVTSNGGFVVQKGDYIYFVNGVDDYDADNNGGVVKSALMRIKTSDFNEGKFDQVDTVVDSLIVAGSYKTGICIFGDYVYYATPTNTKSKSTGEVENSYLDFKRTKLDGTDTSGVFCRLDSRTNDYTFVEVNDVVYITRIVNENNNEESSVNSIYSYNTSTKVDTRLAYNVSSYMFDSNVESNNPYIYYTMNVYRNESTTSEAYNQLYRVNVSTTEAKYGENFNYVSEKDEDENDIADYTYVNYGELILDGISSSSDLTLYNYDKIKKTTTVPTEAGGYTYSLLSYTNGGLYFTRTNVASASLPQESSITFKLIDSVVNTKLKDNTWNAVSENFVSSAVSASHKVISYDATKPTNTAYFYSVENVEHYIYVDSENQMLNVTVGDDGQPESTVKIASNVSGATFLYTANENELNYLYYTMSDSETSGNGVYRVIYDGTALDYNSLYSGSTYESVRVLNISQISSWYSPEYVNGSIFFVNAASDAYSYTYVIKIGNKTNAQIKELNEINDDLNELLDAVKTENSSLYNALYYYYLTGDTALFKQYDKNIKYTTYQNAIFDAFVTAVEFESYEFDKLKVGETKYNLNESFVNMLGIMSEADSELEESALKGYLLSLEQGDNSLGWMVWLAVGVGGFFVALSVLFIILKIKRVLY